MRDQDGGLSFRDAAVEELERVGGGEDVHLDALDVPDRGDYLFVEGVYGHAEMARGNVARVLTERVLLWYMKWDEAMPLAAKLLRTNAAELFGINTGDAL